jgi:hypothetical protein
MKTNDKAPLDSLPPETHLSRKQLAARWACCTRTIARRKDLVAVRFGSRLLRYRLSDVEKIEAEARG